MTEPFLPTRVAGKLKSLPKYEKVESLAMFLKRIFLARIPLLPYLLLTLVLIFIFKPRVDIRSSLGSLYSQGLQRRPWRITILDVITQPLDYDDFSLYQSKSNYALHNGYQIHFSYHVFNESRKPFFSRIPTLYHTLFPKRGNPPDWVFFIDHDLFFMNRSATLDHVIEVSEMQQMSDGLPSPDMILSRDCNNLNIGTMLFRHSDYVKRFLPEWYEYSELNPEIDEIKWWHEQGSFISMYNNNLMNLKNHTAVIPQNFINPFGQHDCGYQYRTGDIIVHFPGHKDLIKNYTKKYYEYTKLQDKTSRIPEFYDV